jgi:hypothetical protein
MKPKSHPTHSTKYSRITCSGFAMVALAGGLCLQAQTNTLSPAQLKQSVVKIETSGHPTVNGITFTNAADRDAVFKAMAAAGNTNGLRMPRIAPTNDVQINTLVATLTAAAETGYLRPQTNNAPSPFE